MGGRQWAIVIVGGDHARRSSDQSNPRDSDTHSLAGSHDYGLCVWKTNNTYCKTCQHVHIIATTFTGNRMDIFQGTDRKRLRADQRKKEMWIVSKVVNVVLTKIYIQRPCIKYMTMTFMNTERITLNLKYDIKLVFWYINYGFILTS